MQVGSHDNELCAFDSHIYIHCMIFSNMRVYRNIHMVFSFGCNTQRSIALFPIMYFLYNSELFKDSSSLKPSFVSNNNIHNEVFGRKLELRDQY